MKDSHCKYVGLFAAALAFGLALVACDDSSSATAPQEEPASSTSQENILSSASQGQAGPFDEFSSATIPTSSATIPTSSAAKECFKEGMADITVRNMERRSITCPNSSTIYDYDLQILYKCVGDALIETDMAPCADDASESSSSAAVVSNVEYGSYTDTRDGKSYKTVVIGGKTWMAENLNYDRPVAGGIDSTFCYDNVPANCEKYGRLYQEYAAKDACPEGWRLPTASDWIDLVNAVSEKFGSDAKNGALRAVGAWENTIFGDNVVATNASGFSALPTGYRASTGECDGEGTKAYFWGEDNMNRYAWILSNQYDLDKESIMRGYFAYAVRCVSAQ